MVVMENGFEFPEVKYDGDDILTEEERAELCGFDETDLPPLNYNSDEKKQLLVFTLRERYIQLREQLQKAQEEMAVIANKMIEEKIPFPQ